MKQDLVSRRLSIVLAISFFFTVASFFVSEEVSARRAHGIAEAAITISEHTLPSNALLGTVRTQLTRMDSLLTGLLVEPSASNVETLRSELLRSRDTIERNWQQYLALTISPGERELVDSAEEELPRTNTGVDQVLDLIKTQGSGARLQEEVMRTVQAVEHLDGITDALATLNRRVAEDNATKIAALRRKSRTLGLALDIVSALLAILSAYFVIRLVRRLWAEAAERMTELEHFAGRVAHDIKSPLSTVLFALDLAKRRTESDGKMQSTLDRGIKTVKRVGGVVDGLLVFAVAGRPPADDRGANVKEVLDGVIEDIRPNADEEDIRITCTLPNPELTVACSPGVLVSMTSNFLVNAIKYMGDTTEREIEVRVREFRQSARVEVRDTGPGIVPAMRARIFDPYVRGAQSTTVEGFGLGLATVRRLAEAHGGSVGVEPNVNHGSVFWFELPRWSEKLGSTPRIAQVDRQAKAASPAR